MKLTARIIAAALAYCLASPLAARVDKAPMASMPRNLKAEQDSDFFTFFHLSEVGVPAADTARAWHAFRPSGPAFHDLVELDVFTSPDGTIGATYLGLDRAFVDDSRNGVFARDIVKSFLAWIDRKPSPRLGSLIANLSDFSNSRGTVILMRGPAPPPPPPDGTGTYGVYLGRDQSAKFTDDAIDLAFTNFPGKLPRQGIFQAVAASQDRTKPGPAWLRIDVRFRR